LVITGALSSWALKTTGPLPQTAGLVSGSFAGFDGSKFEFPVTQGADDCFFTLLSEADHQFNAL
jgi:hypothetical protein